MKKLTTPRPACTSENHEFTNWFKKKRCMERAQVLPREKIKHCGQKARQSGTPKAVNYSHFIIGIKTQAWVIANDASEF